MTQVSAPARYDMPAVFGPSHIPSQSNIPDAMAQIVTFETTTDAARQLLPRFFELDDPIISLSRMTYHGVDYIGGRTYQELVVGVRASHYHDGRQITATFVPVLWVDETGPLVAGRELQGLAKLGAVFPPVTEIESGWKYAFSEYEAPLMEVELSAMTAMTQEQLAKLNRSASEVNTLGWKYIPSCEGPPDADYPTLSVMRWNYNQAWSGEGRFTMHQPDAAQAPYSSRVMQVLASLPIKEMKRAFAGRGSAVIDRAATRRLPYAGEEAAFCDR